MRILMAVSGGVDSAVAAAILSDMGHRVVCVTMDIGQTGRAAAFGGACFGKDAAAAAESASAVCGSLGLEHHVIKLSEAFERCVLRGFREEYIAGRTPNPCVSCNERVKFSELPAAAEKILGAFDAYATGHYARLEKKGGRVCLRKAADPLKDQSYFLYRVPQEILSRTLFPLGDLHKSEVRSFAAQRGLICADKTDSQDFYRGDRRDILGLARREGVFTDSSGRILGHHDGYWNFVPGQRKGIRVAAPEPYYVLRVNPEKNEVVIGSSGEAVSRSLTLRDAKWVSMCETESPFTADLKVRSMGVPVPGVEAKPCGDGAWRVLFPAGIRGVAPGQSAVLYDKDGYLLMGGIIAEAGG